MPEKLKQFIQRWIISTVAVLVATVILDGIDYGTWVDLLVATLVLGLLNSFVRPFLMILSLPLLIFTLGLFTIVINGLLLLLVSGLLGSQHFRVDGFWTALLGALIISIVSLALNSLTGSGSSRVRFGRSQPRQEPPRPNKPDDDGGPVIDV